MALLAARLGAAGLRFGHLIPSPDNAGRELALSPRARRAVEAQIWALQETAELPLGMGPGYWSESFFFPCGPLEIDEYNVDYRGNMTLCCQISGIAGTNADDDVIADLNQTSLSVACRRFADRVAIYLRDKREQVARNALDELDHFPCWYCVKYMGKVTPAGDAPDRSWPGQPAEDGWNDAVNE